MHDDDRYAYLETTDATGTLRNRVWFATGPTPEEPTVAVCSAGPAEPVWLERMAAGASVVIEVPDGRHHASFRRPEPGSFDHDAHLARLAQKYRTNVKGQPVAWDRPGTLVVLVLTD